MRRYATYVRNLVMFMLFTALFVFLVTHSKPKFQTKRDSNLSMIFNSKATASATQNTPTTILSPTKKSNTKATTKKLTVLTKNSNATPQSPHIANKTAILLVTYMRGGSSFLGEVFNQNKDVTYWFEPIAGVYDQFYSRQDKRCRGNFCHVFHENGTIT